MQIRNVNTEEFDKVWEFYSEVVSEMRGTRFDPGWDMIYYPDERYLKGSLGNGEVFAAFEGEKIISCMIVNHELEGDFNEGIWKVDAKWEEVLVMHTFGVLPKYHHTGLSHKMIDFIIHYARENNYKAIRLDVIPGNTPAERLYKGHGFYYVGTFTETWDDGTEEVFDVYELEL